MAFARRMIRNRTHVLVVLAVWASLLVRIPNLGRFLAFDEALWLSRTGQFLRALQEFDWPTTFQTGHPGVTTMWSGTAGLQLYRLRHGLDAAAYNELLGSVAQGDAPLSIWTYVHLPGVVVATVTIAVLYMLLTHLFTPSVAGLAALLLAFDPWYVAHSRALHHDAFMGGFMLLSALALLVYLWRVPARGLLLLSAVCAGLALLSKTLAVFLLPWTGLVFMVALLLRRTTLVQALIDGVIWLGTAWLAFFIVWPAMWLQPLRTLQLMRVWATTYAINPHANGQFFLGQAIDDPGGLYYLVVGAFALTPVVILGLMVLLTRVVSMTIPSRRKLLGSFGLNSDGQSTGVDTMVVVLLLGIYVVAYIVGISLGEKKQDRYLLPALMMMNVPAAVGLVYLSDMLSRRRWRRGVSANTWAYGLPLLLVMGQLLTSLPFAPYFRSYANPLLGGIAAKAWALKTGDGEGMERAAAWLNEQPDADSLTVVATQPGVFYPYFIGTTERWSSPADVYAADYVVIYRSSWQQKHPYPELMSYVRQAWPLAHTVSLYGEEFVWIYESPNTDWALPRDAAQGRARPARYLAYDMDVHAGKDSDVVSVVLYHWADRAAAGDDRLALQSAPDKAPITLSRTTTREFRTETGIFLQSTFQGDVPLGMDWQDATLLVEATTDQGLLWQPIRSQGRENQVDMLP